MKKSTKISLIVASGLVGVGIIIFTAAMFVCGWNFSKLSTTSYVDNTYEINETFDKIFIDTDMTDITFELSDNNTCSVICHEAENAKHSASVQNGALTVKTVDERKWYEHIGINLDMPKMTVYLPNNKYTSLFVETDVGNVFIPSDFSFGELEIKGDTAYVDCYSSVLGAMNIRTDAGDIKITKASADNITLSTSTGNVTLTSLEVKNDMEIVTDTGIIGFSDVSCSKLGVTSDTGEVSFLSGCNAGTLSLETDTGNILFEGFDAEEIVVKTDTGDVRGSFLTDKVFITKTDCGEVDVPESINGGMCKVTTDSGDIILSVINSYE